MTKNASEVDIVELGGRIAGSRLFDSPVRNFEIIRVRVRLPSHYSYHLNYVRT